MHINKHTTKHAPTCTPKPTAIGQRKQGIIAPLLRSILAGGALLCLVACNDMDTSPSGTYPEDQFWTSIEKAQYMLNMVYSQHYSAGTMWNDETLTDNLIHARDFCDERTIRDGNAETTTTTFATTWKNLYAGIKTANMFLENIDKLQASQHTLTRMKAQARYLRAWMYLRLTSLYGDVPYFTSNLTTAEAKRVSRTPHTQVMTAIHNELTAIVNYLPRRDDLTNDERGQITRGAAIMLQARAYLYDADWAAVEQYCLMLMNEQEQYGHYALYPNYQDLFSQDAEYNAEIIADYEYAPRVKTWGEMHDMAPISVGARVNGRAPTESLVSAYLMEDGLTTDASPLYNAEHPYATATHASLPPWCMMATDGATTCPMAPQARLYTPTPTQTSPPMPMRAPTRTKRPQAIMCGNIMMPSTKTVWDRQSTSSPCAMPMCCLCMPRP